MANFRGCTLAAIVLSALSGCGGSSVGPNNGSANVSGAGNVSAEVDNDASGLNLISPVFSGGFPQDGKFNLSLSIFNPLAYSLGGNIKVTEVVASIADERGNNVRRGLQVYFVSAEGGITLAPFCLVNSSSSCSISFGATGMVPLDGRIKIFASVEGQENYLDINKNGFFDDRDVFTEADDKAEPFSDQNNNGQYDPGEYFVDVNGDGSHSVGNKKWDGPNCAATQLCGNKSTVLGREVQIIFSGKALELCYGSDTTPRDGTVTEVAPGGQISLVGIGVSDGNSYAVNQGNLCAKGNPLPFKTKLSFTAHGGGTLSDTAEYSISNTIFPTLLQSVSYMAPKEPGDYIVYLNAEFPDGEKIKGIKYWIVRVKAT